MNNNENIQSKIGIITFHRTANFGSLLQTFGLYKKIERLGYNCEIIDYRCPAIEKRECLIVKFSLKGILKYCLFQRKIIKKSKEIQKFLLKYTKLSAEYNPSNIKKSEKEYKKIIVGSDIVWGRDITENDYNYFLEFVADDTKKYSFASSVGSYESKDDDIIVASLLKKFQKIYVREDEAIRWIKNISGVDSDVVCDPTMLLTKEEWLFYIKPSKQFQKYIFVYFDSDNNKCLKDAIKFAKDRNLKVVFINYGLFVKGVINVKPTTLEEFIGYIYYADFIFTASYHGMLFSLYFNKEFMFYTRAHKSRVLSLARKMEVLNNCGDYWDGKNYNKIDYKNVNRILGEFRKNSITMLKKILTL